MLAVTNVVNRTREWYEPTRGILTYDQGLPDDRNPPIGHLSGGSPRWPRACELTMRSGIELRTCPASTRAGRE